MKLYSWICLVVGLLFLIGMVSADPFILTNSSSKDWLVANDVDQATITVTVLNSSIIPPPPVSGAVVTFTVLNPDYGSFSEATYTTDASGKAAGTFTVRNKSGAAVITASAKYTDTSTTPPTTFTSDTPLTFEQNIDHDSPYDLQCTYPGNGTVKTSVPFDIIQVDRWKNPIDGRKPGDVHAISLHVHGPGLDDVGFFDGSGYTHDISETLDVNGHTSLMVNLTSKPGTNTVMIDRVGSMSDKYKTIEAISNGIPCYIEDFYSPGSPERQVASTDPTRIFTIHYILYDQYMNVVQDQPVWIRTRDNLGGNLNETLRTTEWNGQVWTEFGPKPFASQWVIGITPVNNVSAVRVSDNKYPVNKTLEFVNTTASNLELTVSPQMMPSYDVPPLNSYRNASVKGKVVDDLGNPVGGQTVDFEITGFTYTPDSLCKSKDASFSTSATTLTISAVTGANGIAEVPLYPGTFVAKGQPNYQSAATGKARVIASWHGIQKEALLTWKNYPYLSAVANISPSQVKVGETIDVNLKLNGDGWAMAQAPIDVSLAIDQSGSMNDAMGGTRKIDAAIAAADTFVASMASSDPVGLVAYGYDNNAQFTKNMTTDHAAVKLAIDGLTPQSYTPTRKALYYSLSDVIDHRNTDPKSVQAVILMSDGEFNYYGDPLARGTGYDSAHLRADGYTASGYWDHGVWHPPYWVDTSTYYAWSSTDTDRHTYFSGLGGTVNVNGADVGTYQDLSLYAKEKKVRIYTISFVATNGSGSTTWETMKTLATTTGGKHYWASDAASLAKVYTDIAGELRQEAGVQTQVNLNLGSVIVNDHVDTSGQVFDYVGDPSVPVSASSPFPAQPYTFDVAGGKGSTMVDKYNNTPAGGGGVYHFIPGNDSAHVPLPLVGPMIINQTGEWLSSPHKLGFDVGTVKLNETWETNFRLRVLKEGSISLFDSTSTVTFLDKSTTPWTSQTLELNNLSSFTCSNIPITDPTKYQTMTITEPTCDTAGCLAGEDLVTDFPVHWTTTYSGSKKVTEDIYYIHDNDPRVLIRSITWMPGASGGSQTTYNVLSLASKPLGTYKYYIRAYAQDAAAEALSDEYQYKTSGVSFIKLE